MLIWKLRGWILNQQLSKSRDESYDEYIDRISKDEFAIQVKLADLEDNMDMSRLKNPTGKDYERVVKYGKAREKLMNALVDMR